MCANDGHVALRSVRNVMHTMANVDRSQSLRTNRRGLKKLDTFSSLVTGQVS